MEPKIRDDRPRGPLHNTAVCGDLDEFLEVAPQLGYCLRCLAPINPELDEWATIAQVDYRGGSLPPEPRLLGGILCWDCVGSWLEWLQGEHPGWLSVHEPEDPEAEPDPADGAWTKKLVAKLVKDAEAKYSWSWDRLPPKEQFSLLRVAVLRDILDRYNLNTIPPDDVRWLLETIAEVAASAPTDRRVREGN